MQTDDILINHYKQNYKLKVATVLPRVVNKSLALAEEAVQEAYARAWEHRKVFDPGVKSFEKWFNGILNIVVMEQKREEKGKNDQELEDVEELTIPTELNEAKFIDTVMKEIDKFDEDKAEVLTLWFKYEYTPREIKEVVSMSPSNIRKVISRFRNDIRVIMARANIGNSI